MACSGPESDLRRGGDSGHSSSNLPSGTIDSAGSVFVPSVSRVVSMWRVQVGFPLGVTPDNILDEQNLATDVWRSARSDAVWSSAPGQGDDLMFERFCSPRVSRCRTLHRYGTPRGASHLRGNVTNPGFLVSYERVGEKRWLVSNTPRSCWFLDRLQREDVVPEETPISVAPSRADEAWAESIGRGRRDPLQCSVGASTPQSVQRRDFIRGGRGLDREEPQGSSFSVTFGSHPDSEVRYPELQQVLPSRSRAQLKRLSRRTQGRWSCEA